MGKNKVKVTVKRTGPKQRKIEGKLRTKKYVGDETLRQKERADTLELKNNTLMLKIDSLQHENDSIKIQMRVECKGK